MSERARPALYLAGGFWQIHRPYPSLCIAMPTVILAPNLRRHVNVPPAKVDAATVREALAQVFEANPRLKGYVLDEQGMLRKHLTVFVDGRRVADRETLSDPLHAASEVHVFQALTGG